MTTPLDIIDQRFAALERAWAKMAGTRALNAGFVSTRAAIDDAKARRARYLADPPWAAKPLSAAEERLVYAAPETLPQRAREVADAMGAAAVVSPHLSCPRCLRPDAERADVEQLGVCLECSLAGFGRKQEPASVATTAPIASTPPEHDAAGSSAGAGNSNGMGAG